MGGDKKKHSSIRAIYKETLNVDDRKPVWLALSKFYLDTELQVYDFENIAKVFSESPFSMAEIKRINKYEVFPLLGGNFLSPAGVWDGFDEEWLVMNLTKRPIRQTFFRKLRTDLSYPLFKRMFVDYWKEVEKAIQKLDA